ncbi:MarR family EPS-associated transcriptional regulator [Oricola sp.]|uniref:MarR family EPS-associated transcriptional regulator n=1 Tax=Oricola sp. TaxID=1979950 RepID=UPI0025DD280E|nr:MarR family EPS-associated transcriptional regulator [Oricola sp.]MCI5073633.1 MarR family EPS-associated transcriptional regulator [Oricola sp.]
MTASRIQDQREDVRFRVLRLLQDNPEYSQRDIAQALGVSLGAVNFCLNALAEKGHVKVKNFRAADNKLRYAYLLTPKGASEKAALTARFLKRKLREFEALKAEIEALRDEHQDDADILLDLKIRD